MWEMILADLRQRKGVFERFVGDVNKVLSSIRYTALWRSEAEVSLVEEDEKGKAVTTNFSSNVRKHRPIVQLQIFTTAPREHSLIECLVLVRRVVDGLYSAD